MLLKGKKTIVTGCSRGIGNAITLDFLREGASVWGISRKPPENGDALAEAAGIGGGAFRFVAGDVTEEKQVEELVAEISAAAGSVDVLVNNAGITKDGLVFRMETADWEAVLRTNLTSAFFLSRAVARLMIKARRGSIVNISSVTGIMGNAGQTNYAASKAGLIGFTKSLAREVAVRGVRVNAVAPGFIETDMTSGLGDKVREAYLSGIPMGRMGKAEEVASLVSFLASDRASYVTGQVVPVDGGLAM